MASGVIAGVQDGYLIRGMEVLLDEHFMVSMGLLDSIQGNEGMGLLMENLLQHLPFLTNIAGGISLFVY